MNIEGIFSDETIEYVSMQSLKNRQNIRIQIRIFKDDKPDILVDHRDGSEVVMSKLRSSEHFDFYYADLEDRDYLKYYFKIIDSKNTLFFTRFGITDYLKEDALFEYNKNFNLPDWAKGALMYQIFIDRFNRGDETNDVVDDEYIYIGLPVKHKENWNEYPSNFDVGYFYGGDLAGVLQKLDYLRDFGVEVIYFNPLFVSPSNHKYDTQDYDHIDPHLTIIAEDGGELLAPDAGDNLNATRYQKRSADRKNLEASDRFFAEVVAEAHRFGFRILLDGVFNHCGWDFALWQDVVRNGKASPYFDWFIVQEWPFETVVEPECEAVASRSRPSGTNGKSGKYSTFAYVDTMPKLNTNNPAVVDYLLNVCETWVRSYDIDGLRLDVANELSHTFCRQLYRRMRSLKKDFYLLGEIWRSALPWLRGWQGLGT